MEDHINEVKVVAIECKKAFRKLKKRIGPYQHDMNIYRGCGHRCAYCYALYSQRYMESSDFYHDVFVKENIASILEQQLASPHWTRQLISIGSVCDSYQPIEEELQMMRQVLPLMIRYRTPCIISTKSDLILRDLDLIKQLAEVTYVNIAATITTMEEQIASIIEPGAVSPQRRAEMLRIFKQETKASTGMHVMPMLPYISDDDASFHALLACAKDIQVDYATFGPLNLIGDTKRSYFSMLRQHYPQLVQPYHKLFQKGKIDSTYISEVYKRLYPLRKEYGISGDYMIKAREHFNKQKVEQLSLW